MERWAVINSTVEALIYAMTPSKPLRWPSGSQPKAGRERTCRMVFRCYSGAALLKHQVARPCVGLRSIPPQADGDPSRCAVSSC